MGTMHDKMVDEEIANNMDSSSTIPRNKVVDMIVDHDKRIRILEERLTHTQLIATMAIIIIYVVLYLLISTGGFSVGTAN